MWIVPVILLIGLVTLLSLQTGSFSRGVTIAGKTFSQNTNINATQGIAVETSVAAATAGTFTALSQASKTISTAAWAASVATYTTTANHNYVTGQLVTVAGVTPSGYNGDFVITVTGATTFTATVGANPGAYTSGGTVTSYDTFTCTTANPIVATTRVDVYGLSSGTVVCERGYTATKVIGLVLGLTGGSGTKPGVTTAAQICPPVEMPLTFTGNNIQGFALFSDGISQFTFVQSDGLTETATKLYQTSPYSYIWDIEGPDVNPFAGAANGFVWVSHNDPAAAHTIRVGILSN